MKDKTSTMIRCWLNVLIAVCLLTMAFSSTAGASNALAPLAGTVTKTDALIGDDGDLKADAGETIEYTVVIPNVGTAATGVEFDDNPDSNTTFVAGSLVASPVAVNDTYPQTVIGNVSINSALIPYSVVSNDFLGLNPTATISVFDAISANGGTVTMTTSGAGMGQFTYNPPAGFEGTDTFTYTLTDHANASSAVANRTATVSIPISGMVWFINNSASLCIAAGCGRLSNPFSTLAAFNALNNGTGNNPASNDNIFVYESAAQYTGAVTLLSGQKLIGQDATASLSTITGLTPPSSSPSFPAMNSANGTVTNLGSTVTLNTNTNVRGLQINSTTGTGMNDPAAGIIGVSVSDISISSTTATAVLLSDVGGTFTFTSISSNGGTSDGISLTNTTGSFTVNGDGSNTSVGGNSSGGTIANKSGADGSTSSGIGVYLNNVQNVTLRRITINGTNQNFGIRGFRVNNFTLEYSTVNGLQGDSAAFDNYGEGSVMFGDDASTTTNGMTGTGTITNSIFSGGAARNFSVVNTAGTLNRLTITGSTFGLNQSTGNSALAVEARNAGTVANVTVTGSTFTGSPGDAGNFTGQTGTTMDVVFGGVTGTRGTAPGNAITNTHPNNNIGGSNLTFATQGVMNFHALGNTMSGANGSAVTFFKASAATVMNGYFDNNEIGNAAVVNSGSATGNGIFVSAGGTGTMSYTITNNLIHRVNGNFHISADNTGGSYTANFDIRGNLFDTPGAGNAGAIGMTNGSPTSSDTVNVCAVIGSSPAADKNTLTGFPAAGQSIFLGSSGAGAGHTFNLPGLPSSTETAVQNFVAGNNNMGGTVVDAYADAPATFAAFTGVGTSCSTPISMLPNNTQQLAQVNRKANHGHSAEASTNLSSTNVFKQTSYTFTNDSSNTNVAPVTNGIGSMSSKPQFAPLQAGGIVSVNIGTLPVGKSVTIKFQVTVNGPSLPLGTFQISNQGTVSGSNFSNVLTDDPAAGGTSDPTITLVDRPDTTVTSINRQTPLPTLTNATSVVWRVTFADPIASLTSSNFTLVNTGLTSPSITTVSAVTASPDTQWDVTVNTGTGDGTLGLDMTGDAGLSHDVTNLTFTGQVYTIDKTAPTTTSITCLTPACLNPTNADTLIFRMSFSEDVQNVGPIGASGDFTVTGTTATVTSIGSGDSQNFDITVSGGNLAGLNGTVGLDFNSGTLNITDLAGNALNISAAPSPDETYTVDNAAATVTMTSATSDPTNANPIPVTAQFSENVSNFIATDIVAVNATVGNFIAVDGDTYTFTLTPSGQGLVTADIAGGVAQDAAGNINTAAAQFSRTFDSVGPTVTMSSAAPNPTNTSPIPVTAQFSENVIGFIASDITPGNATVGNFIAVDGDTYTFDLTPSGQGLVTADIPAGVATDAAVNGNTAAAQFSRTFDTVAPTVTISSVAPDPTNTSPIPVTVQFSENVTGFDVGDITPGNATVGNFIAVDGDTYTFELTPSAPGLVTADIAAGVAQDAAGNLNNAASQFIRTFDSEAPTVAMSSAAPNPTNTSPIPVTAQFSENVTGFSAGDITSGNGTVGNFIAVDGDTYTFDLTPSGEGLVTADIAAGVAQDAAGNLNRAASQFNRTFDTVVPTVTINQAAGQADPTSTSPINFTVIFNEPVSGFGDSAGDVTLISTTGATTAVVTEIVPNDDTTYNVAVSGMTSSGTVIASIPAGSASDAAGNSNTLSGSTDNTVTFVADTTPPTVLSSVRASTNPTSAATVDFTVTFSEAVTGVGTDDFDLTTTGAVSGATVSGVSGSGTTYTVTVDTGSGDGTLRLDVLDDGTIIDAANNPLAGGFTTGEVYTIIKSSPFADVQVDIAGSNVGNNSIAPQHSVRPSYAGIDSGPVRVESTNGIPIVAALRDAWMDSGAITSSTQLMGLPENLLFDTYLFPAYNNVSLDDQLRFANVDTAPTTVTVTIGGIVRGSYPLNPSQSLRVSYAGLDSGPVEVKSSGGVKIIASIRDAWHDGTKWSSYAQLMGLPANLLSDTYLFPAYNNVSLDDQLRFANVGTAPTIVTVTINGVVRGTYPLNPSQSLRVSYPALDSGPVEVKSSGGVKIIASLRDAWHDGSKWTSYAQLMGLPQGQLSDTYLFPAYDNVSLDGQLRFANVDTIPTTITVTINGVVMGSYPLNPSQGLRVNYAGLDSGPIEVKSSGGVKIIASLRDAWFDGTNWTSYSQMMGLPASQLSTVYLFPAYNNVTYDNQLRIAVP